MKELLELKDVNITRCTVCYASLISADSYVVFASRQRVNLTDLEYHRSRHDDSSTDRSGGDRVSADGSACENAAISAKRGGRKHGNGSADDFHVSSHEFVSWFVAAYCHECFKSDGMRYNEDAYPCMPGTRIGDRCNDDKEFNESFHSLIGRVSEDIPCASCRTRVAGSFISALVYSKNRMAIVLFCRKCVPRCEQLVELLTGLMDLLDDRS